MTKTIFFGASLFLLAIYWAPAIPFPDQTRAAVNASYLILALMNTFMLLPDVYDMVQRRGAGMSWQAIWAKTGFFLVVLSFSAARVWAIIAMVQDFPDWITHSPIGSFFTYTTGIGLAGIFYGFGSVGDIEPKLSYRGMIVGALAIGIIVGAVVSHLPI